MGLVSAKCPNCGADIQVDESRTTGFCQYCGSSIEIQSAIQLVKIDKSEDFDNFIKLAEEAAKVSNFEEAQSYIKKALEINPRSSQAWKMKMFYMAGVPEMKPTDIYITEIYFYEIRVAQELIEAAKNMVKYAKTKDGENQEVKNAKIIANSLFLNLAYTQFNSACGLYGDTDYLYQRYQELEDYFYQDQLAHWGRPDHKVQLQNEDRENICYITGVEKIGFALVNALYKQELTENNFSIIKKIISEYCRATNKLNRRYGIYNTNLSDFGLQERKEQIRTLAKLLPSDDRKKVNTENMSNEKVKQETNYVKIVFQVILFIILFYFFVICK